MVPTRMVPFFAMVHLLTSLVDVVRTVASAGRSPAPPTRLRGPRLARPHAGPDLRSRLYASRRERARTGDRRPRRTSRRHLARGSVRGSSPIDGAGFDG